MLSIPCWKSLLCCTPTCSNQSAALATNSVRLFNEDVVVCSMGMVSQAVGERDTSGWCMMRMPDDCGRLIDNLVGSD